MGFHDIVVVVLPWVFALAAHLDGPRARNELVRVARGIALVGSELVEVIVARDVGVGSQLLVDPVLALHDALEPWPLGVRVGRESRRGGARPEGRQTGTEHRRGGEPGRITHEPPPVEKDLAGRNLGRQHIARSLDQHRNFLG